MKGRMPRLACGPFLFALLLAGCGEDSRPSAAEDEQLNNAAELLDSAPETLEGVDDDALGNASDNSADQPA